MVNQFQSPNARSVISELTPVRGTVSSGSRFKTESTIPIEDEETISELLDTLNNSDISVTLQKSSEDSGHHSLCRPSPSKSNVTHNITSSHILATKNVDHTNMPESQIIYGDPELDDSQLLEDIFFIH